MRLRDLFRRDNAAPSPEAEEARARALAALAAERARLEAMKAETPHYAELGQALRGHRERNHISERLTALYLGRQQP